MGNLYDSDTSAVRARLWLRLTEIRREAVARLATAPPRSPLLVSLEAVLRAEGRPLSGREASRLLIAGGYVPTTKTVDGIGSDLKKEFDRTQDPAFVRIARGGRERLWVLVDG